jgi:lipopolysaccharide export system protein LptA
MTTAFPFHRIAAALVAGLLAAGLTAAPARAQLAPTGGAQQPIDIDADNAVEWHQDRMAYVARGHARATQGDTTVYGDVLTAYYRQVPGQGNKVYQLVSDGNVRIVSPNQEVVGDHAVYDADRRIMVVTGRALKLTTPSEVVTARDSLEYFEEKSLLVARGDALAIKGGDRLRADTLVGLLTKGPDGTNKMQRIDGAGNVVVVTAEDVAKADKLVYSVADEVAVLIGDVRITRGDNQLHGQTAEMNMKTKVNRIIAGKETGGRVKGLLNPDDKPKGPGAAPAPAPVR